MFAWYEHSTYCWVYLEDVGQQPSVQTLRDGYMDSASFTRGWTLQELDSAWFTRGWTLQELLAPRCLIFSNRAWNVIGHKCQGSRCSCPSVAPTLYGPNLNDEVSSITGIGVEYLKRRERVPSASVARRMSWAAKRQTTRTEDLAYCSLGIFDVNMPLLYGEGKKAFMRLQQEIVRKSTDESIFAWADDEHSEYGCGFFAESAAQFNGSGDAVPRRIESGETRPYSLTNAGLEMVVRPTHAFEAKLLGGSQKLLWFNLNCDRLDGPAGHVQVGVVKSETPNWQRLPTRGSEILISRVGVQTEHRDGSYMVRELAAGESVTLYLQP